MGQLLRVLISIIFFMMCLFASAYLITDYLDRPYKFISVSTRQCSYIQEADGTRLPCSAEDKNRKYIYKWCK